MRKLYPLLVATSVLYSCSLAPGFDLPQIASPEKYKSETPADPEQKGIWKEAVSLEASDRGKWWKIFSDLELDALEEKAMASNNSLKAAASRLEESRALVRSVAMTFLPDLDLSANAVRAKSADAANAPFSNSANRLKPYNLYSAGAVVSYDVDLFGRVRDNEKARSFEADSEEALYRSMLLALQADVADHYFTLRALDAERALLRDTVKIRTEAQRIMQKRYDAGSTGEQDISRTASELATAQAELISLDRARAGYENSLAVLLGEMPSEFHFVDVTASPVNMSVVSPVSDVDKILTPAPENSLPKSEIKVATGNFNLQPPQIPAGIPSTLLQRRPDVAGAQYKMAAANRRIGVARTAFFPDLLLTVSGGYQSTQLSDLFKWSSRSWALGQTAGSALAMNIFDSGRNIAKVDAAEAEYEASVLDYKQQVLVAFQDVENALTAQKLLAEQSLQQDAAARFATRTFELTQKRYDEGDADYFEVVDAQRNSLAAERTAIQTRGARMSAAVNMVRALGGSLEVTTESENKVK